MNTSAKFLFIMDPFETLNLETETSLLLMQDLIERGHSVYWLQQEDLALVHDQPMGLVFPVTGTEPLQRKKPTWSSLNRLRPSSNCATRTKRTLHVTWSKPTSSPTAWRTSSPTL